MIIDTTGIEADNQERVYIKQEGSFLLKVVKVTKHTKNNKPMIKVFFKNKLGHWAIDEFYITENALWKIKVLSKALKLPTVFDTDWMLGRYVIAEFKAKKTQNGGVIYEIKNYKPSKLTNTYEPPKPDIVVEDANGNEIDINPNEIPF